MSTIQRANKTELALNNVQITACKQHAGAARWAYSWGLARKQEEYRRTGTTPSALALHRDLIALKQTEVPWMYAVSTCAPQEALRNLDRAFAHFFRRVQLKHAGKHRGKLGYPRFKAKKRGLGSFRLTGSIVVFPEAIQWPRLGRLRLKERGYLPVSGSDAVKILSATVSEHAGHWYVHIHVEHEHCVPEQSGPVVGVDLGVKALSTLSDGTVIPNPKPLKRRLQKLKRLHRTVSRKPKGSQNRKKAARKLDKAYWKMGKQQANTLHQVTTMLAKIKSVIVIEDLHVAGMLKNHHLAQVISDVGFSEFRRHLPYKAAWHGSRVVVAARWGPSSKTCSRCGWVDADLTLADRVFCCQNPVCRQVLDCDLNAALDLAQRAGSSSESQNACGEGSAGQCRAALVELPSLKQEPNTDCASA
ncbi:MAG TPA: RNA-guided endonuclease TnpB family protein [Ktedonobacterales bacterium]|nr:RNA-guided endonuclease TnpB family protein [Ktedonobacterales bacterium]